MNEKNVGQPQKYFIFRGLLEVWFFQNIGEAISIADRVLVLTRSPASIKKIIPIQLDIIDRTPMKSRNAPEFKNLFNEIWKELNQYG